MAESGAAPRKQRHRRNNVAAQRRRRDFCILLVRPSSFEIQNHDGLFHRSLKRQRRKSRGFLRWRFLKLRYLPVRTPKVFHNKAQGKRVELQARRVPPWVDVNLIDRPRNQATTCPPAHRGRDNARRIAVSAKWRIVVAVILDRCVFLPDNPGWRHAAAPLGLPWALMCNTFGVMIFEKVQHQK